MQKILSKLQVPRRLDLFYSFQVHNSESDIDALCVGPCFATIEVSPFLISLFESGWGFAYFDGYILVIHVGRLFHCSAQHSREQTRSIRYSLCQRCEGSSDEIQIWRDLYWSSICTTKSNIHTWGEFTLILLLLWLIVSGLRNHISHCISTNSFAKENNDFLNVFL